MRAKVAKRAAAGDVLLVAPTGLHLAIHAPFLQIDRAPMINLAQLAAIDELLRLLDGGHKAIVEGHHVFDAGRLHRIQH